MLLSGMSVVVFSCSMLESRCALWSCFFKQETAYELRISDWSSDVCSSDLYSDPDVRVHLGHRRLSIVDIAGGYQPMWDGGGEVGVTFNGEIYNHLEIGRASCRERVCQYVLIPVVAVSLKKK